jgi:hypothetical protein
MGSPLDPTIKKLQARKDLFAVPLSPAGRNWFTTRIVKHVQAQPDIEKAATALLTKAKALATPRLPAGGTKIVDKLESTDQKTIRASIVYGVLGTSPDIFLDGTGQDKLLDFTLARRFRSLQRLTSFINPNETLKIFGYPLQGLVSAKVNKQADPFWEGSNTLPSGSKGYPFVLSTQGKSDPKKAIENLFEKNKDKADRTLIDCPAAAMVVHQDALLTAQDPSKLALALASEGPNYVAIDHAFGPLRFVKDSYLGGFPGWLNQPASPGTNVDLKMFVPQVPQPALIMSGSDKESIQIQTITRGQVTNVLTGNPLKLDDINIASYALVESTLRIDKLSKAYPIGAHLSLPTVDWFHAVNDDRSDKALFDRQFIDPDDLQTGDHVYLANHPLHRTRIKNTPWNGEHSFVVNPWASSPSQIEIIGHGILREPVLKLTNNMLEEINAFLDITRKILDIYLALPSTRTPDKSLTGTVSSNVEEFLAAFLLADHPVPFTGTRRVFNMPALTYTKNGKKNTYPGYWMMDLDGTSGSTTIPRASALLFDYDPKATKAKPFVDPWPAINPVALLLNTNLQNVMTDQNAQYALGYLDDHAGIRLEMPLYYPLAPKKGSPVRLNFDDIKESVFFGLKTGKLFVIRPRVSADAAYLARLQTIGAIA